LHFLHIFSKNTQKFSCKSFQWEPSCSMWTEGQTDEVSSRFSRFCERTWKRYQYRLCLTKGKYCIRWTSFVRLWNVALCFPCADSWPGPRCLYNQVLIRAYFFNPFNQLRTCVRLLIQLWTHSASYCSVELDPPAARRWRSSTLPCELQWTTCSGSSFNILSPRRSRRRHVVLRIFKTVSLCMYRMSYWILSRQLEWRLFWDVMPCGLVDDCQCVCLCVWCNVCGWIRRLDFSL